MFMNWEAQNCKKKKIAQSYKLTCRFNVNPIKTFIRFIFLEIEKLILTVIWKYWELKIAKKKLKENKLWGIKWLDVRTI